VESDELCASFLTHPNNLNSIFIKMETANLIMLIVALIVLLALSFFIFQIWVQSKETKLQISNFIQELQKGFTNSDTSLKAAVDQICLQNTSQNKPVIAALEIIKEQLKEIGSDIKKAKEEINQHIITSLESSDTKLNDAFEGLKTKTYNRIGELNETSKLFKEQLEDRIKELDKHLTEKLVYDLTELTKKYSGELVERNTETLKSFSAIAKEYIEELKQKHQDGLLCDINHPIFKKEIDRINFELDYHLLT